jgi:hypothetical protein
VSIAHRDGHDLEMTKRLDWFGDGLRGGEKRKRKRKERGEERRRGGRISPRAHDGIVLSAYHGTPAHDSAFAHQAL